MKLGTITATTNNLLVEITIADSQVAIPALGTFVAIDELVAIVIHTQGSDLLGGRFSLSDEEQSELADIFDVAGSHVARQFSAVIVGTLPNLQGDHGEARLGTACRLLGVEETRAFHRNPDPTMHYFDQLRALPELSAHNLQKIVRNIGQLDNELAKYTRAIAKAVNVEAS